MTINPETNKTETIVVYPLGKFRFQDRQGGLCTVNLSVEYCKQVDNIKGTQREMGRFVMPETTYIPGFPQITTQYIKITSKSGRVTPRIYCSPDLTDISPSKHPEEKKIALRGWNPDLVEIILDLPEHVQNLFECRYKKPRKS